MDKKVLMIFGVMVLVVLTLLLAWKGYLWSAMSWLLGIVGAYLVERLLDRLIKKARDH